MDEPKVIYATVRESVDDAWDLPINDIECRFDDGQKFAAIVVDGDFPELAHSIATFLTAQDPVK